jgi:hypothetical protein
VDSKGLSGGLLSAWNPKKTNFDAFMTPAGILLDGFVKQLNKKLKLVNCYGPYANRQMFWDNLKVDGILKESDLILGGDLNFTVSAREVWGCSARNDLLASFFNILLHEEGLIDVEPINLLLTWRNGRGKHDFVAKRLDHFLISEKLAESGLRYRSWVVNVKLSDHMSVVLQFDQEKKKIKLPFKFNSVWLKDPEFVLLVHSKSRVWLGTVISLVTVGDLRYCFSGEKKWQAIQRWRSRSLMGKALSYGSSRWKIFWWREISGSQ